MVGKERKIQGTYKEGEEMRAKAKLLVKIERMREGNTQRTKGKRKSNDHSEWKERRKKVKTEETNCLKKKETKVI